MSTPPHGRRGWTAGPALLVALGLAAALEPASGADEEAGRSRSDRSQPGEALPGGGPLPGGLAFDSKGITYRSGDGLFEANLGGRLHLDFGGEGRGAALGERSLWRGQVRRTWGELALTYERVWAFGLQVDAAGGDQPIYDLALGYSGLGPFVVTVGNFKEPFSLK